MMKRKKDVKRIVFVNYLVISKQNLAKKFGALYTPKEIDNKFEEFDKDKDGYLNLKEFIEVILPDDFYLDPQLVNQPI